MISILPLIQMFVGNLLTMMGFKLMRSINHVIDDQVLSDVSPGC